jgi:YHS domain-containing protein
MYKGLGMKTFLLIISFIMVGLAVPAFAGSKIYTGTFSNKAVSGYDVTAYFTEGKAVKGSSKFKSEYEGAVWYFSSAANKEKFDISPIAYAPQYGGYCAWAVAQGYTASGDPNHWAIEGGKLYLNYNKNIKEKWDADRVRFIKGANKNWPDIVK